MTDPERRRRVLHALIITLIVIGITVLCTVLRVPGDMTSWG